jgi:molybdenum cofactor cytidylyltransferase
MTADTHTHGMAPLTSLDGQRTGASVAVLLLAGGLSSRMGQHKCLLPFDHSESLIEHIAGVYAQVDPAHMVLVANMDMLPFRGQMRLMGHYGLRVLANHSPRLGRLHSLQLGLAAIPPALPVLVHNTDNPFVGVGTVAQIVAAKPGDGYVSPRYKGQGGHPILLSPGAAQMVRKAGKQAILKDVLHRVCRMDLEVDDENILSNINTPDDYMAHFGHMHLAHQVRTHA